MERRYRLQKNGQFQYVYRRGKSAACKDLVMLYAKGKGLRVGFSVSKKVGNAVVRNRTKRRLRECFRPYLGDVKNGLYVFVARPSAAEATFQSLEKACDISFASKGCSRKGIVRNEAFSVGLHPVLPAANQSAQAAVLPLYPHLLVLRGDGHHPLWRAQGGADGGLACIALQSFQQGRL